MMVLPNQAKREFVGDRFAFAMCARCEQLFNTHGRHVRGRMCRKPGRIAASGWVADDIDEILDGEAQAAKRAVLGWR